MKLQMVMHTRLERWERKHPHHGVLVSLEALLEYHSGELSAG